MSRHALLLLVSAFVLLLPAPARLRAESDEPSPEEAKRKTYESKLKDVRKKAATSHASLGDWLWGKKMWVEAVPEFQKVLVFDPEHSKAHERLGFVKKDGKWLEDPKKAPKKKDEVSDDKKYAYLDEYNGKVKKEGKDLADAFFGLGDWCKKNGLDAEADEAWRGAIDYDKDHAKAREALGFKKEDSGAWVGASDRAEKDAMAKKAAGAPEGEVVQKDTADDKGVGKKLLKRQSQHFFYQTSWPDKLLAECVKLAETTRDEFYTLFEVRADTVLVDGLIWGILLKEQKEYHSWIDVMVSESQGAKDQLKHTGGHCKYEPPQYIGYEDEESGVRDFVVHYTVHVFHHYYMNPAPGAMQPWLYEGMAHYFSHRLLRTGLTNCFVQSTGNSAKAGVPRDSDWWKQFIRSAVVDGRDPEMAVVMAAGINQLDGEMLVKAWSVIEWLMSTRKTEFLAFHEALKATDGTPKMQEQALKQTLGWDYAELDHQWEEYVRKSY